MDDNGVQLSKGIIFLVVVIAYHCSLNGVISQICLFFIFHVDLWRTGITGMPSVLELDLDLLFGPDSRVGSVKGHLVM